MLRTTRSRLAVLVIATALISLCVVFIALRLMGSFLNLDPVTANTPDEIFRAVLLDPPPADVSGLAAGGDTWQGYRLWARFNAGGDTRDEIIRQGYEPVPCEQVLVSMEGQSKDPLWTPHEVAAPTCLMRQQVTNGWTHLGTHYLLIDESSDVVYFFGIGA